jgi:hypothetical protein
MPLSLHEIEKAVDSLTADQKRELHRYLEESLDISISASGGANGHSVLDIAAIHLGSTLRPPNGDDDLLGEMLEGRQ